MYEHQKLSEMVKIAWTEHTFILMYARMKHVVV